MTPLLLLDDLKRFLEEVVKDYSLDSKIMAGKEPQVVLGWLPIKGKGDSGTLDFPYVVAQLNSWEDTDEESKCTVTIQVGTYSQDMDGWKDTVNVMTRIREKLLSQRIIGNRFRIELPLKVKLYEEQPYPYWIGDMVTTWIIPAPLEIPKEDVYD